VVQQRSGNTNAVHKAQQQKQKSQLTKSDKVMQHNKVYVVNVILLLYLYAGLSMLSQIYIEYCSFMLA